MTPDELDGIKRREREATPGPWIRRYDEEVDAVEVAPEGSEFGEFVCLMEYPGDGISVGEELNAEFIAHSRADIPRLVSALEEAWGEIERLKGAAQK